MANERLPFSDFWEAYGLKRSRRKAETAWGRLTYKEKRAAFAGISAYREACRRDGISMAYAAGYLNNRRWEDEDVSPVPAEEMSTW